MNRRVFLAAQASLAALGLSSAANASIFSGETNWKSATSKELTPLIGKTFTAKTSDGQSVKLKLADVKAHDSGRHRPAHLRRAEGVTIGFKNGDHLSEAVKSGHQLVSLNHPTIGQCDLMMTSVPQKSGGYLLEAVLN